MDTGGLPSHLTIAENAYVRLTPNIDVTDGLANRVRSIIQKIIINEDGAVNTILVKFDNEGIVVISVNFVSVKDVKMTYSPEWNYLLFASCHQE